MSRSATRSAMPPQWCHGWLARWSRRRVPSQTKRCQRSPGRWMTVTSDQAQLFGQLQSYDGATAREAAIVLAAVADTDRVIELVGPKGYVHGFKYVGPGSPPHRAMSRDARN